MRDEPSEHTAEAVLFSFSVNPCQGKTLKGERGKQAGVEVVAGLVIEPSWPFVDPTASVDSGGRGC